MTTKDTEKRIEYIREVAPLAAVQKEARDLVVQDEFRARQELLVAALAAAKPALTALETRLPLRTSRAGCAAHDLPRSYEKLGDVRGIRILPSVAVVHRAGAEGKTEWEFMLDRDPFAPGRCGCFTYDWQRVPIDVLLREVSLSDLVEGLAQAIDEQLQGRHLKGALQFEARAKRLRAVAVLVGENLR